MQVFVSAEVADRISVDGVLRSTTSFTGEAATDIATELLSRRTAATFSAIAAALILPFSTLDEGLDNERLRFRSPAVSTTSIHSSGVITEEELVDIIAYQP